ncbi:P1 family peptidase [Paludibaculum fermentans]|uniref:P1 family peptidase n=1 Tax=Paludibaculum fermentans TaxID=1473598 RepID=A0A7S7SJP1_PALFE|nr:P1 family peptidase [Paludibaculum fermentans]QOY86185.1 P1 family peptidase [Paludibaculum fermentans]
MKGLTDIDGILVGHASDYEALTGCTVILCEQGAVAGYDIRGGASGTEEAEVMSPFHIAPVVHAVVLAGGSAFGLEAASGVRRFLEHKGVGFPTGAAIVPIVPAAILYDLGIGKANIRPTREMGEAAASAATADAVKEGNLGAGTGATIGKALGMKNAMKGGLGSATVNLPNGVKVSALVAVNALGDVVDPATGRILAGARKQPGSREFAGSSALMKQLGPTGGLSRGNTTLAVVATNAKFTKVESTAIARHAHHGLVKAISPVHTSMDGDMTICLSYGKLTASVDAVSVAAAEAVAEAIVRAVKAAKSIGGVPGLAG